MDKVYRNKLEKSTVLIETNSYSNPREVIHVLECSACGRTCEHVNGSYPRCPHCGAKVVDEFVRCKDCLYYEKADYIESDCGFCGFHDYIAEPDDFCSWGKRMSE